MKTVQELITCFVVLAIFGACALAFPSTFNRNDRSGELETLLEEIRKELRVHQSADDFSKFSDTQIDNRKENHAPAFGTLGQYGSSSAVKSNDIFADDSDQFTEVKRQGSWDLDYGLGGGRFGKRAGKLPPRVRRPADYFSLGGMGGRFGRDVDHVNELDNDFDDGTEYE